MTSDRHALDRLFRSFDSEVFLHRQIYRWFRIALWSIPLVAIGVGVCALPIWPASLGEGGYGLLCSAWPRRW